VRDNLTPPKGAAPHPPRSLALVANLPARQIPTQAEGDITLPDIPHGDKVSRNNGKKEPRENFPLPSAGHIAQWKRETTVWVCPEGDGGLRIE